MPVEVREIRVGDIESAVAFAHAGGSAVKVDAVVPAQSVMAIDGEATKAVLLSLRSRDGGHEMELTLGDGAEPELARRLIDTVLLKMRSRHIAKSRLRITGEAQAAALWETVNWTPGQIPGQTPINAPGRAA